MEEENLLSLRNSLSDINEDHSIRKRSFSSPESVFAGLSNSKRPLQAKEAYVLVQSKGDQPPKERYGQSAVVNPDQGMMYIFGGCNTQLSYFSDELYAFNFHNKTWKFIKPPEGDEKSRKVWPQGRHFHSAVAHRGLMYICGGKSNGYMCDLYTLNFETLEWTEIIPVSKDKITKRYGHTAVVCNDSMFVFGGYDDFGLKCNDLWEFNFSKFFIWG